MKHLTFTNGILVKSEDIDDPEPDPQEVEKAALLARITDLEKQAIGTITKAELQAKLDNREATQ